MFPCYGAENCCPIACALGAIGWILIASVLLYVTWNKVVVRVSNLKPAKFWYALLVVITLLVFCAPRYMMHKGPPGWHKGCSHAKYGEKGPCPYSKRSGERERKGQDADTEAR